MSDKSPLMFIHGMWSRPRVWDRLSQHFESNGHQTIAPALPGHDVDPSDPVPAVLSQVGLRDYVDAMEKEARTLEAPPVLIGHSMGALLAQLLATRIPVRGVVLLSTAPSGNIMALGWEPLKTTWDIVSTWGYWTRAVMLPSTAALYGIFNNIPADEAEQEIRALVHDSGKALFQVGMAFLDFERSSQVDYEKLTAPALVLVGDDDRITPASISVATARRLSGPVMYREMPGYGHWIIGAQGWPTVAEHIEEFFERHLH
jgi:pimeloyl-ACP methyl ester carboxylesterase